MKQQIAVLRALIRNYRLAICRPQICRMLAARREFFTDAFIAEVVLLLVANFGQWETTRADLQRSRVLRPRVSKFLPWAEGVRGGAL